MLASMGTLLSRLGAALTIVGALALAGCASPLPEAESKPAPVGAAKEVAAAQTEDDMAACGLVAGTLKLTLDIVTAMVDDPTGQSVDAAHVSQVADVLREMLELTTAKMDAYAGPYASAIILLDDMFEGRADGSQTVDTGAYRDATIDIMSYCVDEVGYSAD